VAFRASDEAILDLLRTESVVRVDSLASALGVTPTAVRQRLERLMRDGMVTREPFVRKLASGRQASSRGRPAHGYRLTEKGRRTAGDNFRDLAMVLWKELRAIEQPEVRRGLISRIGSAMADLYRPEIGGGPVAERLNRTVSHLQSQRIPCHSEIQPSCSPGAPLLAVLTSHVCPYPDLAEQDRGICAAERIMLGELLGAEVKLTACRLDGMDCCRFSIAEAGGAKAPFRPDPTNDQLVPSEPSRSPSPPGGRSSNQAEKHR
jgi:predicted ArsR family transcriptional regulator